MRKDIAALSLALWLAACGEPVPQDHKAYVGYWTSPQMSLLVTADGRVAYERVSGSTSKSIKAPIKSYESDGFTVGFGPFGTSFKVSRPPYQDGGKWKMVVDGVELVRTSTVDVGKSI
ncbi:hypothetical protein NK553_02935 [Pseudomonas sp. ZM23]|uniref:Lipoprotein n=1 Tax=Pseudomonas triclosanedens TaxID=2961893 RepID=A0ABY6ZYX7_9PSED|nr:hypothetical protein [Pseudomonas triclosanedens]MCP8462897.1 hypothetical protein [Pseudomonas triclosanedens]MCP8468517.1 hypothetical protein [Pseudomonas triclosanedens]MCP8475239.1 hypothetical protein [Pseudomonas triclosanedens]WAI50076.1 hypothetical protein OU419_02065 [Pseudomonas triclosanedens]